MIAKKSAAVVGQIQRLMKNHGLTLADIEFHLGGRVERPRKEAVAVSKSTSSSAKYRDPRTGATWSGRGRAPSWIASANDRSKFLNENVSVQSSSASTATAKPGNYVRGVQPAKYRNPKTGQTWSGRGKAPAWMASARDRSRFLINDESARTAAPKVAPRGKRSATSAAMKQPSSKRTTAGNVSSARVPSDAASTGPAAAENQAAKKNAPKKAIAKKAVARKAGKKNGVVAKKGTTKTADRQ
nr:H-NS histone family protein [Paraburkholderia graminis]